MHSQKSSVRTKRFSPTAGGLNPQFPMTSRAAAQFVAEKIHAAGHRALFAGGCVRDTLLGREPKDFDIATSARPEEVLALFPGSNEVGAHFGVVIVKYHHHMIEVATFRTDGSYRDGRHPETVTFSNEEEDAARRDFTVNGLFEDPFSREILDYVGGKSDLKNRTLRAIGHPADRFREDALRLMRAIRFSTVLGFEIEAETWQAIRDHSASIARISPERIRDEFSHLITSPDRARGLELFVDSGLAAHIIPELLPMIGCEQPPEWHPEGDVYTHTRIMLGMLAPDAPLELCLAVLLHDVGKPPTQSWDAVVRRIRFNGHDAVGATMAEDILRRLRYPNAVIESVVPMVDNHMNFMNVQRMRTARLKRFMARPDFKLELELHRVDCASSNGFTDNYDFLLQKESEFASQPLIPPSLVSGKDIIALGLPPNPRFKEWLEAVQTEQLEGRIQDRDQALDFLRDLVLKPGFERA